MKKITKTIITHSLTLATVGQNMELEVFETREVASTLGTRELSKMSKEMGKQVVIAMDVPIERKYSMTADVFIEHATLEDVNEGDEVYLPKLEEQIRKAGDEAEEFEE